MPNRPFIGQGNPPFPAAYTGENSLFPFYQMRETFSLDGYLGYKAFEGTEFYFQSGAFQGFGLSVTHGLAAFPNDEAQKAGFDFPHYNTARLFLAPYLWAWRRTGGYSGRPPSSRRKG